MSSKTYSKQNVTEGRLVNLQERDFHPPEAVQRLDDESQLQVVITKHFASVLARVAL